MSSQFNPAKSTSYIFTIANNRDLTFKLQNASIGAVNLGTAPLGSRYIDLNLPDNKIEYGPMALNVLLSEDLQEWFHLYKWMTNITRTNDAHLSLVHDAELTIMNAHNVPIMRFTYKNLYPISLSDIIYSVTDEETTLICPIVVQYDSFDVENLITNETIRYGDYN